MKMKAYFLVFEGLADWEASLALCEINKHPDYQVLTVGFSKNPVNTMGGLCLLPAISLDEVNVMEAAIFIMPGGTMWEMYEDEELTKLLRVLHEANVPLAAICGATLMLAKADLLRGIEHTSNSVDYLKSHVPSYCEEASYRERGAICSHNIITASGLASVSFAYEILKALSIYDEPTSKAWLEFFS